MKKIVVSIVLSAFILSCTQQRYAVTGIKGERIMIRESENNNIDTDLQQFVNRYKSDMDREMSQSIGQSAMDMTYGRPESLLTNLTSDVMLSYAQSGYNPDCDIALMNVHGHRANLAKGNITVGNMFEIYSFENTLAFVQIKGEYLLDIFDSYAKMGGAGVSSNVKLVIKNKKLISATVNGETIDKNKIYTIVTLDYLADGNDGMEALISAEQSDITNIVLRDVMMDYIKSKTSEGEIIASSLDGRITIAE